jgi:hypothetical protein
MDRSPVTTVEHVERMRQVLKALCDDVGAFLDSSSSTAAVGSTARAEMADSQLAEQLLNAYHEGSLLLESAGDHAFALTRLLTEPVPTVAPWTCARGALEAAALSCWLLASDLSARERVSRSYAYRYDGLREQEKLARASGDEASRQRVTQRIDQVERQAIGVGYPPILNKHRERIGIGEVMPSKTKCIEDTLGQETFYRIFSAMAHSQSSALIQLGFLAFDPDIPTLRKKAMNSDAAAVLLLTAADSLTKPTWAKAQLFGLDLSRLKQIFASRYGEMGLNETRSHWL